MKKSSTGHDARSMAERVRQTSWRGLKLVRQRLRPRGVSLHVFVAGMQRSGTNLLMDMLDISGDTQVFHETDPRAFDRYEMCAVPVIKEIARQCPASTFVIKTLCELDRVIELMEDFRPAKTLWLVRDWRDSANSAVKSFGNFVPQWRRLAHGDASDWRGRGMSDSTRKVLLKLYRDEASEIEGAAIMWFYRNVLFFEQHMISDPRARLVFYEDLVQNPAREMAQIYAFLGLPAFPPALARRIHTRSVQHQIMGDVSQPVQNLCDDLLARYAALRKITSAD